MKGRNIIMMKALQRLGRALMLPVAVLPAAAILAGLGNWLPDGNVVGAFLLTAGTSILVSLGMPFVIGATILNIGWLIYTIRGFFMDDDITWANYMFYFSLTYLSVLFILMFLATLPIFN